MQHIGCSAARRWCHRNHCKLYQHTDTALNCCQIATQFLSEPLFGNRSWYRHWKPAGVPLILPMLQFHRSCYRWPCSTQTASPQRRRSLSPAQNCCRSSEVNILKSDSQDQAQRTEIAHSLHTSVADCTKDRRRLRCHYAPLLLDSRTEQPNTNVSSVINHKVIDLV